MIISSINKGSFLRFMDRTIMNYTQQSVHDHRTVVGSPLRSMSSLGSYSKTVKNLGLHVNQTSNQEKTDFPTSHPQNMSYPIGKVDQNLKNISSDDCHKTKQLSIIEPRSINQMRNTPEITSIDTVNNFETSYERLQCGMVYMKNYFSLKDQVEIVKICQEYGAGPGGFYEPFESYEVQRRRLLMCFGRNWQPATFFDEPVRRNDGSEAPPLPDELITLVKRALQDARAFLKSEDEIPSMLPDTCLVNFYPTASRLGLHQDCNESPSSLERGLPIVSFSIGDTAEFLYGDTRVVEDANKVLLKSGDVLIFGGKSRLIFHGVKKIIPDSAPLALLKESMLKPGRLNLNFRQH